MVNASPITSNVTAHHNVTMAPTKENVVSLFLFSLRNSLFSTLFFTSNQSVFWPFGQGHATSLTGSSVRTVPVLRPPFVVITTTTAGTFQMNKTASVRTLSMFITISVDVFRCIWCQIITRVL